MKKRPKKEGKGKKRRMIKGLRLRKTVRGNTVSRETVQINMKVIKAGRKKLEEIFPKSEQTEQAAEEKPAEEKIPEQSKPEEKSQEAQKSEEKKEEQKEEDKTKEE